MQELAGELIDLQVPLGAVVDASLFDLMASTIDGNCAVNDRVECTRLLHRCTLQGGI